MNGPRCYSKAWRRDSTESWQSQGGTVSGSGGLWLSAEKKDGGVPVGEGANHVRA